MTCAVDRVASRTTEGVVVARQIEIVLPLVRAMAVEIVGVEVGDDARGRGIDEVADAVVRHGDGRGDTVVVIFGARQIARVVVRVVGCNATRPGATGEFAVGRVGVRRALAVGVHLVRHTTRRFVVEPTGHVAIRERLVAVGRHQDPAQRTPHRYTTMANNSPTVSAKPPYSALRRQSNHNTLLHFVPRTLNTLNELASNFTDTPPPI